MRRTVCLPILAVLICFNPSSVNSGSNLAFAEEGANIPTYVQSPPDGHFTGISAPMNSITEARQSAMSDAIRQVLRSVGTNYHNDYLDVTYGDPRNSPQRYVNDRLVGFSNGVIHGIEQNIVRSDWVKDESGRYVCFILVRYPERLIKEMRRLSNGARVLAAVTESESGNTEFILTELNGVSVVFSSAKMILSKNNRLSKAISFFVWKVPEYAESQKTITFRLVRLQSSSRKIILPIEGLDRDLKDYLLGAKVTRAIEFHGIDEIGRPVTATAEF